MKNRRLIPCLILLGLMLASALYAAARYQFTVFFNMTAETAVCISVFFCAVMAAVLVKNRLVSLAAVLASSVAVCFFFPAYGFLFMPPLLLLCMNFNSACKTKSEKICFYVSLGAEILSFIIFIITLIKTPRYDFVPTDGSANYAVFAKAVLFATAIINAFIFSKSFAVIKPEKALHAKNKKKPPENNYSEKLHTVYLLSIFSALTAAAFSFVSGSNSLTAASALAWAGYFTALAITGDPVTIHIISAAKGGTA